MSNQSFVLVVISPERAIHEGIASALNGNRSLDTLWSILEYPNPTALAEILKPQSQCVIFLDCSDPIRAKTVAVQLVKARITAAVIAIHPAKRLGDVIELMQLGIREVISSSIAATEVIRTFASAAISLKTLTGVEDENGHLYAFLPAKPGVGATTIAAHSAAASARLTNERTLLVDFDFRLGITSFLFKLDASYSVLDAIASQAHFGSELWDRMVCRRGKLDILGSAPAQFGGRNPETDAVALLDLALQSYRTVCVDLPGDMRDYEIETLNRAKECFLVTTSDIGALHLANRKAETLHALGLRGKISVIMNRADARGAMAVRDLEAILQMPVRFSVDSAERQIIQVTEAGEAVQGRSPLARQIESIARGMNAGAALRTGAKPGQVIEKFPVSGVRDRSRWGW